MIKPYVLKGENFNDPESFYREIYSLMPYLPYENPAPSLDTLNDVLYSSFGKEEVLLIWKNCDKSKLDLGLEATKQFYQHKLETGKPYNTVWAQQKLKELNENQHPTLFEIICSILEDHKHITLVLET